MSRAARESVSLPSGVRGGPLATIANHGAILRRCMAWDGLRGLRQSRRDRGARDLCERARRLRPAAPAAAYIADSKGMIGSVVGLVALLSLVLGLLIWSTNRNADRRAF